MYKAVFALVLFAGFSQPAAAQTAAWADKMFAGDLVHDFGVVPHGKQLKYTFKMTNIWAVPLELTNIRVSCSCTSFKESTRALKPGETGFLTVNMDATRFSGLKKTQIFITLGPENVSTATLTLHANARLDVVFNPGEIDFGLVHRGQTPTKPIDVEYAGTMQWAVTEINPNASAPFTLKVEELRNRGTRGYRIFATMKPDAPTGSFKQEVLLKTNDPASPTLTFNILGNIQATLSVAPDVIVAGAKIGTMEEKKLVVKGSRPFRILGIDGQGEGITAVFLDREAQTQIVTIRFQPERAGEMKKQLVIRTDLDDEKVTVPVQGNGT
jgi:hypothetical protein